MKSTVGRGRRFALRAAVVTAVLVCATACAGGHRDAGPRSETRNAAFIARAERICARARVELEDLPAFPFLTFDALHPKRRLLPRIGRFFTGPGNELPIIRRLDARLSALGAPPSDPDGWSEVLDTFRRYVTVFEREDTAALRRDVSAWVGAVRLNRQLHTRLAGATGAFGARGCDVL